MKETTATYQLLQGGLAGHVYIFKKFEIVVREPVNDGDTDHRVVVVLDFPMLSDYGICNRQGRNRAMLTE